MIPETALMLNADGSIYHLNLFPEELATVIFLVGDPARASTVSHYFDRIDVKKQNREFIVHTGYLGTQRASVIGTGIGVGNIDIVINEADALANVDFRTRRVKENFTPLRFIRVGTSGAIQADIPIDSLIVSEYAIAFDGLMSYYLAQSSDIDVQLLAALEKHFHRLPTVNNFYAAKGSESLIHLLGAHAKRGITLTLGGFYGPQHRQLRAPVIKENIIEMANSFSFNQKRLTNIEMETAGIYGLCQLLGHDCCSLNAIVANRITETVSKNPLITIKNVIEIALEKLI